jgi:ParB family chromosome partitioning protein
MVSTVSTHGEEAKKIMTKKMFQNIGLAEIDPNPEQPRGYFAGIEGLAESIRDEGLLEPIMVRPLGERYQIVHGERRFRACKLAGLDTVPAVIRRADDETTFRLSLIENVQRSALTPIEEAQAFAKLADAQGLTQAEIGRIIGKGQSYVAHKLRLLKAPPPFTYYLEVDAISENHFRQAMRLKNIIGENIPDNIIYPDEVETAPKDHERWASRYA